MSSKIPARALVLAVVSTFAATASSSSAQVQLVDVAPNAGLSISTWGRGVAMGDFDQDGLLDVIAANAGMNNGVWRQKSDHTFQDAYALWGFAADVRAHWGILAADFDNDGDVDVYVLNGGFTTPQTNQLLRNDLSSTGAFTDVSLASGDADLKKSTFGGTTLDYDRDGLVDVFMSNLGGQGCTLLRNLGGMYFLDVTTAAGIAATGGNYRHCSAGDLENDGWIDVAVGNYYGFNLVYHNNGDGTFTDVAATCGLSSRDRNFGLVLEDFDNDGWMDAYLPKYQQKPTGPSLLFLNNGDGTFRDVTTGSGMTGQTDMGHNTGDIDGDGYPDIFIGTGAPSKKEYDKLFLITPNGSGGLTATDVSSSSGLTANGPTRAHGSSFGDYDGDGDVDLYQNNGGPEADPNMLEATFLWQNQGNGNAWLEVDLLGVRSNRSAIGARARVHCTSGRDVYRFRSAGKGFGNTDSPTIHFGLGGDLSLDELFVTWPSGITQRLLAPAIDQRIAMVETGLLLEGDPTPGATLTMRACGPANDFVDLLMSTTTGWTPWPGVGVLELGVPYQTIVSGPLNAAGLGSLQIVIPNNPALIGTVFHLQALVHTPTSQDGHRSPPSSPPPSGKNPRPPNYTALLTNCIDVAIH